MNILSRKITFYLHFLTYYIVLKYLVISHLNHNDLQTLEVVFIIDLYFDENKIINLTTVS